MRKNEKNQTHKPGKIFLKKTTRTITIVIISMFLLISLIATLMVYQTPTTSSRTITVAQYSQSSAYTYLVYLKNNTLYDTPFLLPNQGEYFKQIIDDISASITYTYHSNITGSIHGNYSMYAEIQTDLWTKKYPLTEQTPFTSDEKTTTFSQHFSINYSYYDQIVSQINTETGVTAPNPLLKIHTNIILSQITNQGTIYAQLSPEFSMTLTQKTIEISKNLTSEEIGSLTKQTNIYQESVAVQQSLFTGISVLLGIMVTVIFYITRSTPEQKTEIERIIKKIYKQNGEWIHKTVTPPPTALQHTLRFASIEDLIKISEDLNKPILHYTIPNPQCHIFYILDSTTTYLFELTSQQNENQDPEVTS